MARSMSGVVSRSTRQRGMGDILFPELGRSSCSHVEPESGSAAWAAGIGRACPAGLVVESRSLSGMLGLSSLLAFLDALVIASRLLWTSPRGLACGRDRCQRPTRRSRFRAQRASRANLLGTVAV